MTAEGHWRGHPIHCVWYYSDTNRPVSSFPNRVCGYCNLPNRVDEHDACLGELPGVMNACCGHGAEREAYIQFNSGEIVRGSHALTIADAMKTGCKLWNERPNDTPIRLHGTSCSGIESARK